MNLITCTRALAFAGGVALMACGGGSSGGGGGGSSSGGGGSSGGSGTSGASCDNLDGTWTGSAQVDASACGKGTYTDTGSLIITQATGSCSVTIAYYSYGSMDGTVSGSTLSFSGSYPKFGGTISIDNQSVTLSADQTTLSGTVAWSYQGGSMTCSGTTAISGTKGPA